jgi:hypothetical protein
MHTTRSWIALGVLAVIVAGCGATAPSVLQVAGTWDYEAGNLTDGQVTCIFGAPMTLTQTSATFTGTYRDGYISCTGPTGASSTLVSGTVDSGAVSGKTVACGLTNTDVTNSGEITEMTIACQSSGAVANNVMTGTATATVVFDGVPHALTGEWRAPLQ